MHRDHGGNLGAINFSAVNSIDETSVHRRLLAHGKCAVKGSPPFSEAYRSVTQGYQHPMWRGSTLLQHASDVSVHKSAQGAARSLAIANRLHQQSSLEIAGMFGRRFSRSFRFR
jgi:hypothetical protein